MLIKNYLDHEIEIDERTNAIKPLNHVYDAKGNRYRIVCISYNYCNQMCVECRLASTLLYIQSKEQEANDGEEYNLYTAEGEEKNTFF